MSRPPTARPRTFGHTAPKVFGAVAASAVAHAAVAAVLWIGHDPAVPAGAAVVTVEVVAAASGSAAAAHAPEAYAAGAPTAREHAEASVPAAPREAATLAAPPEAAPPEAEPTPGAPTGSTAPAAIRTAAPPDPEPMEREAKPPTPAAAPTQPPALLAAVMPPRAPAREPPAAPPAAPTDAGERMPWVLAAPAAAPAGVKAARGGDAYLPDRDAAALPASRGPAPWAAPVSGPGFEPGSAANPLPTYPARARRAGLEGRVVLHVAVDASGQPSAVSVLESSGHRVLDTAARAAVAGWRFLPARAGATPVAAEVAVPIRFRLDE